MTSLQTRDLHHLFKQTEGLFWGAAQTCLATGHWQGPSPTGTHDLPSSWQEPQESPASHKGELGEYHTDTWVQDSVSEVEDVFMEKFPELTAKPSICTTQITQHP